MRLTISEEYGKFIQDFCESNSEFHSVSDFAETAIRYTLEDYWSEIYRICIDITGKTGLDCLPAFDPKNESFITLKKEKVQKTFDWNSVDNVGRGMYKDSIQFFPTEELMKNVELTIKYDSNCPSVQQFCRFAIKYYIACIYTRIAFQTEYLKQYVAGFESRTKDISHKIE